MPLRSHVLMLDPGVNAHVAGQPEALQAHRRLPDLNSATGPPSAAAPAAPDAARNTRREAQRSFLPLHVQHAYNSHPARITQHN